MPIPSRRERKKKPFWFWASIVIGMGVLASALVYAWFTPPNRAPKPQPVAEQQKQEEPVTLHDKTVVMLMGIDERKDDVGRSDTLMVIAVDPKTDTATLLSIPRDSRVRIERHGYDKINAAYAYGDEKLAQSTVEDFLGINIDHYVIINVNSFVKVIDAIGGVDIDVEQRMYYEDVWDDGGGLLIDLQPGMQHMDGKTAVTYVRYRDEEGDIGRVRRQQKFMRACLDQATSPAIISNLPAVLREVLGSVRTDLSFMQILEIAGTLRNAERTGLKTETVPGEYRYIGGVSYFLPDIGKLHKLMVASFGVSEGDLKPRFDRAAQDYEDSLAGVQSEPLPVRRNRDYAPEPAYTAPPPAAADESPAAGQSETRDESARQESAPEDERAPEAAHPYVPAHHAEEQTQYAPAEEPTPTSDPQTAQQTSSKEK